MPSDLSFQLRPLLPAWAVVLLAAGLLALLAHGSRVLRRKGVPPRWVGGLAALRAAAVVAFVLGLLQPVVSFTRTAAAAPELLVLVDTSQSMGLPAAAVSGSRLDEVRAALAGGPGEALRRHYRLRWYAFDRDAVPLDEAALAGLEAGGATTRYADSLASAWNHHRNSGTGSAAARRALLVSDGNDLGAEDPAAVAGRLGLAVDTLAPAAGDLPAASDRVEVAEVQGPRRTLLGSETRFRVTLRGDEGGPDRPVTLHVHEGSKEVVARDVVLPRGRAEERVEVAHRPVEPGARHYRFRVGPRGAAADAAGPAYKVSLKVLDARYDVLVLEDTWRWEFKYLRRVFEDDPSFSFTALLARGNGAFAHFAEPDRRSPLAGFPRGANDLDGFDLFLLGDVDPARWPRALAPALARAVTEDGKSLVVVAGPNLARFAGVPELATLLPVELARESGTPVPGPVDVRVATEGVSSPFFFAPAGGRWGALPALDQIYPVLRKRPGATVLLEAARQGNAFGPLIVMAEQTVGRGRVLFVGTDTLWKWQTLGPRDEAGVTPYRTFWQQALRALAPARSGRGAVNLWLRADRSRYEAGQRVGLRAEVQAAAPPARPEVRAAAVLPDGRRLPLAFAADPADPGLFRAAFESRLPGPYHVEATLLSEGSTVAEAATTVDVAEPRAEQSGVRVDRALLARLSAATGGRVIDPSDPATWPAGGDPAEEVTEAHTLDPWDSGALLLVLAALLAADWLLRLLRGYV